MANRIVHFEIEAKDKKRASKFYQDAFGWKMEDAGEDYGGYVSITTGPQVPKDMNEVGINGGMFQVDKKELNAFSCVVGVDDIKKAVEDVKAAGGKVNQHNMTDDGKDMGEIMDIPMVGLYAKCEDTEGNRFTLLQPAPGDWSK